MTVTGLPQWLEYTIVGLIIIYYMFCWGKIMARLGHSPGWSLALLLPYIQIITFWVFAFKKWPIDEKLKNKE
ncbi:MAG: hypothetical protein CMP22_03845 [Rickettsiales bacterium]|nr:hypothetical protein [Rickettsiales bacterium]